MTRPLRERATKCDIQISNCHLCCRIDFGHGHLPLDIHFGFVRCGLCILGAVVERHYHGKFLWRKKERARLEANWIEIESELVWNYHQIVIIVTYKY